MHYNDWRSSKESRRDGASYLCQDFIVEQSLNVQVKRERVDLLKMDRQNYEYLNNYETYLKEIMVCRCVFSDLHYNDF